jgi:hypothetical protein
MEHYVATQNKNQSPAKSETVSEIAKNVDAKPETKLPDNLPDMVRVRAVHGPAYHLLTGELIPVDADKKVKKDAFTEAQLRAGKWVLVD